MSPRFTQAGVAALVFVPAGLIEATVGLQGAYSHAGVALASGVLAITAGLLFPACLRLAGRTRARTALGRNACALLVAAGAVLAAAVAFVPLAVALRLVGWLVPSLRYSLAMPEQFLYAVALHPYTGAALLLLLLPAYAWARGLLGQAAG